MLLSGRRRSCGCRMRPRFTKTPERPEHKRSRNPHSDKNVEYCSAGCVQTGCTRRRNIVVEHRKSKTKENRNAHRNEGVEQEDSDKLTSARQSSRGQTGYLAKVRTAENVLLLVSLGISTGKQRASRQWNSAMPVLKSAGELAGQARHFQHRAPSRRTQIKDTLIAIAVPPSDVE